jgi:hypothetical protein
VTNSRAQKSWIIGPIAAIGALCLLFVGAVGIAQQASPPNVEPEPTGAPTTLRRLTESQYRNSIADIFGEDVKITGRFERGVRQDRLLAVGTSQAGLSPFSFEQYDQMARGISSQAVDEKHRHLLPCQPKSELARDDACVRRIVQHFGLRLFRRPLTPAETRRFTGAARESQQKLGGFYDGVRLALGGMLTAPDFLFRIEHVKHERGGKLTLDGYSKATRLSYFLTDSTPDDILLRAAAKGELDTISGLKKQSERLVGSPNFERGVRAFFWDMLAFDTFPDLAKDPVIYPAFSAHLAADAQEQTMRTIVDQLISRNGDYRELFTTQRTHLTRALGIVYQLPVRSRTGWEVTNYPAESGRSGILTDVSFLALHSHPGRSSPTIRGKSIREIFLCQTVPPPPADVDFSVVQDSTNTTMPTARMRLSAHATQKACNSCHRLMDPLGLPLENFDGLGTYRTRENGAVIDASGTLDRAQFDSAAGLGQALHDSPLTTRCLVSNIYRYAAGRNTVAGERSWMDYLNRQFQKSGYRIPQLMQDIAASRTFYAVSATPSGAEDPMSKQSQKGGA